MPTFATADRFKKDFEDLNPADKDRFETAVKDKFVPDLATGTGFRPGLRIKPVRGVPGVFEMTWAPDGRATFQYGEEVIPGEPHVVWRRVGTHDILTRRPGA